MMKNNHRLQLQKIVNRLLSRKLKSGLSLFGEEEKNKIENLINQGHYSEIRDELESFCEE